MQIKKRPGYSQYPEAWAKVNMAIADRISNTVGDVKELDDIAPTPFITGIYHDCIYRKIYRTSELYILYDQGRESPVRYEDIIKVDTSLIHDKDIRNEGTLTLTVWEDNSNGSRKFEFEFPGNN